MERSTEFVLYLCWLGLPTAAPVYGLNPRFCLALDQSQINNDDRDKAQTKELSWGAHVQVMDVRNPQIIGNERFHLQLGVQKNKCNPKSNQRGIED